MRALSLCLFVCGEPLTPAGVSESLLLLLLSSLAVTDGSRYALPHAADWDASQNHDAAEAWSHVRARHAGPYISLPPFLLRQVAGLACAWAVCGTDRLQLVSRRGCRLLGASLS